ncbi:hypothetical protein LOTGIDRAFT_233265 [Lottia gigantea]|uniref:Uncharacterized protein n=1 Tax=Lottia gigantea TaxID=225164 RepID=V4AA67_LOTGI|nr:hypothetical protein LOTGIDRAFT_233265 [Lottia gigantea]ESO91960.1 hypothetical protein LOTGIDRAFT_233265 [Lottia gigantea]
MDFKNIQTTGCGSTSSSDSFRLRMKEAGGSDEVRKRRVNTPRPTSTDQKSSNFPQPNLVLARDDLYEIEDFELIAKLKVRHSAIDLSKYVITGAQKNDTMTLYKNRLTGENRNMVEDILAEIFNNLNLSGDIPEDLDFDFSARIGELHHKKVKKPSKMRKIGAALRRVRNSIFRPFASCFKSS